MIPEAEIKEVKQSADILALFRSYGLKLEKKGKDWFASCPFHDDDTPSLSINTVQNVFHCLSCGEKGNAIQLVQKMESKTFPEAFKRLSAESGRLPISDKPNCNPPKANKSQKPVIPIPSPQTIKGRLQSTLETAFKCMQDVYQRTPDGTGYLEGVRGLKNTQYLEIGYCTKNFGTKSLGLEREHLLELGLLNENGKPHFGECVVFPLKDLKGKLVGLYGRKVSGRGKHYYNKGKRKGVFSIHDGGSDSVYITESIIDALSVHQLGFPSVLALHGVNGFTPVHEQWLKLNNIRTVYLLLDGDAAGREASDRLYTRLQKAGYTVHNIELPEGKDPNSFFSLAANGTRELKALSGYPKPQQATRLQLIQKGEEYIIKGRTLTYTVKGLTGFGFDRMRVTVKCTLNHDPSQFYIDNLDLYSARGRGMFIDGVCSELKTERDKVAAEVKQLIVFLEKERLAMANGDPKSKKPQMTPMEKEVAFKALKDRDIIKKLLADFEACGIIGEEKAKILGFLGTISRLLPKPLGVLIVSRSGAGKTTLQDAVSDFVPEEYLIKYTRLTGQALFYKDADGLKHKVLTIEEEEGMEQAMYSIRTLQSSQRLCTGTTRTDPKTGKLKTDEYTVKGPVFIMLSTTNPDALDTETRCRFVIITVDESAEQTKRIFKAGDMLFTAESEAWDEEKEQIQKKYQNMQRLLRPLKVRDDIMPLMDYPIELLQHRRERTKYRTLLHSIALLRQYQRPVHTAMRNGKPYEYINVEVEDVALANELALAFFPNALDHMAPHTRRLGEIISEMTEKANDTVFTRKALRDWCGWTDWSIRQGLEQLLELEYIAKLSGANGVQFKYKLLVDVRSESRRNIKLTSVTELKRRMAERQRKEKGK